MALAAENALNSPDETVKERAEIPGVKIGKSTELDKISGCKHTHLHFNNTNSITTAALLEKQHEFVSSHQNCGNRLLRVAFTSIFTAMSSIPLKMIMQH